MNQEHATLCIETVIPFGEKNAIEKATLLTFTGHTTEDSLNMAISHSWQRKHPVLETKDGKVYRPANAAELEEYLASHSGYGADTINYR